MPNIITIAFSVEGTTDVRFLQYIIQRTFEDVALMCEGDIDVYPAIHISNPQKESFMQNAIEIARLANLSGIHVLCIHADADSDNDTNTFNYKINPSFDLIANSKLSLCKNLVAIVPIQMSESWMIADRSLLKDEIDTNKSNAELGIARKIEGIADPKFVIEEAIRLSQHNKPKKSRNLTISELYQPIGQKISLQTLENLPSYKKFKSSVIEAFKTLNYLN